MIKKLSILAYGLVSYLLFVAVFGYTILFIGNIGVSPSLDAVADGNLLYALLVDLGLLGLFAVQHSVMARPAFKRWFTKIIPEPMERSTYVLLSSVLLGAIVYYWQPLGGVVWQIENSTAVAVIYGLFAIGWAILFSASFQQNHFDLFGLRQVWLNFRGKSYTHLPFKTPYLYRKVRHPLYVGMMIGLWAAPVMTVSHLAFALLSTAYIVIGTLLEERDLEKVLPEYKGYKVKVPMFVPKLGKKDGEAVSSIRTA